jgi:glycosyltransferase involved in cell wall biosynthesis
MAADCTDIAADHPESAADEVIGDAGLYVDPTVDSLTDTLDRALRGERPAADPTTRAEQFDWDVVDEKALATYRQAVDGT